MKMLSSYIILDWGEYERDADGERKIKIRKVCSPLSFLLTSIKRLVHGPVIVILLKRLFIFAPLNFFKKIKIY